MNPKEWSALTPQVRESIRPQLTAEEIATLEAAQAVEEKRAGMEPAQPVFSTLRILLNLGAIVISGATLAPLGIFHAANALSKLTSSVQIGFWLGYFLAAAFGALLPNRGAGRPEAGMLLTFFVISVAVMNLAGCAKAFAGFSNVT